MWTSNRVLASRPVAIGASLVTPTINGAWLIAENVQHVPSFPLDQ